MQRGALICDVSDRKPSRARMAGHALHGQACPKSGTGQGATSPGMGIEVNGYSGRGIEADDLLCLCSGRSMRAPLFIEETARLFRGISVWKKASLLQLYVSETAGLSGTGWCNGSVPMTVLIGIERITNSTEEDATC